MKNKPNEKQKGSLKGIIKPTAEGIWIKYCI
jgi:hypothetical protein